MWTAPRQVDNENNKNFFLPPNKKLVAVSMLPTYAVCVFSSELKLPDIFVIVCCNTQYNFQSCLQVIYGLKIFFYNRVLFLWFPRPPPSVRYLYILPLWTCFGSCLRLPVCCGRFDLYTEVLCRYGTVDVRQFLGNGLSKSVKDQSIIIVIPNHIRYNASVIQIQYCAEIYFILFLPDVIFKFRYIGKPFLIRCICKKLSI